jgi:Fe-S-cluster containining protein
MLTLSAEQSEALARAVDAAEKQPQLRSAIDAIYADVQAAIDARRPRCDISGRCCRFESYGHRLFVTTAELAAFRLRRSEADARGLPRWDGTGCPFQVSGLCGAHSIRPFGCRIYFCDPTADAWQQEQYETFHARLKAVHESLQIPYFYVEWREGLRAVGIADVRR